MENTGDKKISQIEKSLSDFCPMGATFFEYQICYSIRKETNCFNQNVTKLCFETKSTKIYSKMLLVKSSENKFVFSPAFYLIMCFMKAPKNFGKRAILKMAIFLKLFEAFHEPHNQVKYR